ncbi:hypothetical protein CANCADRAFT_56626 [Tortispora caseinolytica NRRL Y-17796]|uniref:Uncharacterized protein n=1 Tax=Tortispora caseinolytica NRRL Y-17796 TaxID=767744 RepID=A0A1E4TE28_9ASCO|nr:hypothetical protein CANCADRAFT_56626 [Tortispora caseinolytica NRRL Y-17796]
MNQSRRWRDQKVNQLFSHQARDRALGRPTALLRTLQMHLHTYYILETFPNCRTKRKSSPFLHPRSCPFRLFWLLDSKIY